MTQPANVTTLHPDSEEEREEGGPMVVGQWTGPGEVRALQAAIAAHIEVVRSGLARCATAGTFTPDKTPGEWAAWQSLKTRAQSYIAETPAILSTVSQFERGEVLQKEIAGWHVKSRGFGCEVGPAPDLPPDKPPPILSTAGLTQTGLILLAILYFLKEK